MYLSHFRKLEPTYRVPQADGLAWLAAAHARSGDGDEATYAKYLRRFGCGPGQIEARGTFLKDFTHRDWAGMQIFGENRGIDARQAFFREILPGPVGALYEDGEFDTWIHVTCTGYASPSVVQQLASQRGYRAEILHAYHMGCYAALPAIRMARGNGTCDILHTELCTLHLDPAKHDPEQLVIQSLFADGVIRYRAADARPALGYAVEQVREVIAPGSLDQMTWEVAASGFSMRLAREVPRFVGEAVAGVVGPWRTADAVYAIHPGGPRIIDGVKDALSLSEEQVYFSREILRRHGNMSSATLPHVWELMMDEVPNGTPVISLAFGPGLTVASSLMRVVK